MRWPFRRRRDITGTGETPSAPVTPAVPATPAAGRETAPARQWAALPAIPVTITRGAPLVAGPAPVLPPLRPSTRSASVPEVAPATGSVTGLVRPVPQAAAPVEVVADALPLPPVPVVRRAARPVPAEAPAVLTDAVDEYVGEPREAAEPYRAPSWLRFATNPGLPVLPGLPGPVPDLPMTEPPSFLPPELRSTPEPSPSPVQATASEPPPRMVEGVERAEIAVQRPMRKRRPNLGQTRRLGLGAPIPAPAQEILIHPEAPPRIVDGTVEPATPQEPPPPSAAPVRVATERAPEPEPEPEQEPPAEPPRPPEPPAPPTPPTSRAVRPNAPDGPAPEKRVVVTSYRATTEPLPVHKPRSLPRGTVVDRVPADLAHAVRAHQHADVSAVPVYRGPKVGEAAKARGAKAFASGGAVFLPDEAGPTDSPEVRGILAHELVHAVQQRTLGPVLPAPDSPLGQQLEAEAQAAERFYGGESGAEEPAPLIHAPQQIAAPAPESAPDLTAPAQLLTTPAPTPTAPTATQPIQSPFDSVTKAEVGRIAEESARNVVTEWTNPKLEPKQGKTSGGTTTAGGQQPAFDRAARREEMVRQTLETINQERFEQGKEPLTDLDAVHYERIDRQLDDLQNGTTSTTTAPQRPNYRPNSKEAWLHGLTGMDPSYGLGLTGFREKAGTEKSWFGSETGDKRPLAQRLMTGLGLASEESATQFDTKSWYAEEPEQNADAAGEQSAGAQGAAKSGTQGTTSGTSTTDESPIAVSRLDLDELSERLYDRLRSRLRMELLVDRERAGLLTDFR